MSVAQFHVSLANGRRPVHLRELNGFDEQSVAGADTANAISLLDRLMAPPPGSAAPRPAAAALTASERDRLLAAVYQRTYGELIESTSVCAHCGSPFDLTFSIERLLATLDSSARAEPRPDGTYLAADGTRFRLPTGEDELSVVGLPPEEAERALFERCVVEPGGAADLLHVQEAMEQVAPVLDLDLRAVCPECGAGQMVHFDVQSYLLSAIGQERRRTALEVHRLAIAYGWGLNDILSLTRAQRRLFAELIETDLAARPRTL